MNFKRFLHLNLFPYIVCFWVVFTSVTNANNYQGSLEEFDGMIIDSIIIDNQNIRNPNGNKFTKFVFNTANKLHITTRLEPIKNELLFKIGDEFSHQLVEETSRNIRARLAINDVWIMPQKLSNGRVKISIRTIDQWSLLATFQVDREGNETNFNFGLEERNLFGRAQFLSADYFVEEQEDDYFSMWYTNNRVRGNPLRLRLQYSDDPFNKFRAISFGRPFYDLQQKFAISGSVANIGGRNDEYRDTLVVAQWENKGDEVKIQSDYRFGSYLKKVTLGLDYKYLYESVDSIFADSSITVQFPIDSMYHEFAASIEFSDLYFIVESRINGFEFAEDIELEKSVELTYGRAFNSSFKNHHYDQFIFDAQYGTRFGSHIFLLKYERSYWFRSKNTIRKTAVMSASMYNNRLNWVTGALRIRYISDDRDDNTPSLNLGGKNGLRGFNTQFATGDRLFLTNIEGRFFPGVKILSVLLGGVVFADIGKTFNEGENFNLKNVERSLGVGLRISLEKLTRQELIRVDLAYGQDDKLHLIVNSGQHF